MPVALQSNGTVTPLSTVDLHPQTTSTIRTVHIKEGQFVKKGELMFSLDDRSDAANVDKAHAQIARDQAALADVERQYKRSQDLVAQKFLAQSAVDTLKSQVDAAAALLKADQAALRSSGVSASYNAIRAPMSGRVGAINVYPGSLVQLSTSLTTITQLDPITVSFTLPETALGDLLAAQKRGKVAVQASPTSNTAASGEGKPVTGAISFIDNTVDPPVGHDPRKSPVRQSRQQSVAGAIRQHPRDRADLAGRHCHSPDRHHHQHPWYLCVRGGCGPVGPPGARFPPARLGLERGRVGPVGRRKSHHGRQAEPASGRQGAIGRQQRQERRERRCAGGGAGAA